MCSCLDCFGWGAEDPQNLQLKIDIVFPNFHCESEKCSIHSPGIVENDELLAFLLIDPLHYDKEADVVVPEAFIELTNRDLSLLRVSYVTKATAQTTKDGLIERGLQNVPPKTRLVDEVCLAAAEAIRSVVFEERRMFAVYDTGLKDCSGHASIFTHTGVLSDRRMRKIARQKIHEVMTQRKSSFSQFHASLADP